MVHYAYAHWRGKREVYRFIMVAANPETIDEWWRKAASKEENHVKRITPDFYTYDIPSGLAWDLVPQIDERIIWTNVCDWLSANMTTVSQPQRADVVSGGAYAIPFIHTTSNAMIANETKRYYIRSKSRPDFYWMAGNKDNGMDHIRSSNQGRTRFILNIEDDHEADKKGTVIIGSDFITITAVGTNGYKHVGVNGTGALLLQAHSERMVYKDLKNRFLAQGWSSDYNDGASVTEVDGYGEEWELVQ
ncbi:hypothetical protein ACHAP5_011320 [Fusarium lateritium]